MSGHMREDTNQFWAIVQLVVAVALAIALLVQWLR